MTSLEPSAVQEAREAARQSYEYRVAKANGYADHFETAWDALIAAVRAERPAPAPSVTSTNLPPGTTTTYINPATIAFTAPAPRVTEGMDWVFPDMNDPEAQLVMMSFKDDHQHTAKVIHRKNRQFVLAMDVPPQMYEAAALRAAASEGPDAQPARLGGDHHGP